METTVFRLLRPFTYHEPRSVSETLKLLSRFGSRARIMAGGTDLLISMKKREIMPEHVISIKRLSELNYIKFSPKTGLRLGPLATHATIAGSSVVRKHFPMLATACNEVGTPQVRNMGTIGGNLCKAGPSQDTPPVLIALEARLKLVGPRSETIVPLHEFCTGAFCTILAPDELLTEIQVPIMPSHSAGCYKWCTKISAVDETLAGAGVVLVLGEADICRDIRIGLGSVAPMAMRARQAENLLRGKRLEPGLIEETARTAAMEAEPRSRAEYRRHMIRVLVQEAIHELWRKIAETTREQS
jgi:carbon-monoxide dehydrogenase medium subunit